MKKNNLNPLLQKHTKKPVETKIPDQTWFGREMIFSLIIVFCVPVLLYIQTSKFGLIDFDDDALINKNQTFLSDFDNAPRVFLTDAFTDKSSRFYRPIQTLSYMVDIQLSGKDDTWMFHLTNILLLGLIACILFLLLRKFLIPLRLAILSTLVYCAHPLFVSNVAWIPARGDLQLMIFSLLSFLFFIEFLQKKQLIYLFLNWGTFSIALFCKETAAVLPLLFIIYYFTYSAENRYDKKYLLLIALYLISGVFWFWLRLKAIGDFSKQSEIAGSWGNDNEFGLLAFLHNLQTIPESLVNFFIPFDIDPLPNFSFYKTSTGIILLLLIIFLVLKTKTRSMKEKLLGLLWFLILLLPTMFFKHNSLDYLHHRFFMPMVGIMLLVLFMLPSKWIIKGNIKNSWILIVVFFIFSSFTFVKSHSYSDPMTFYNSAIAGNSNSDFAYIHRGYLNNSLGRTEQAMDDFTKTIELNPGYAEAYNNRGIIYNSQGEYEKAIVDYTKAIELKPKIAEAYNNRGLAYGYMGMHDKAITDYLKVIEINPEIAEAYNNLGMAYGNLGIYDKALSEFTRAIELKPDYGQAYNNRGIVYIRQGKVNKACEEFGKAKDLGFGGAEEYVNRFCK
jgi:tetratricopeptide (TPR) repeat protein